MFDHCDADTTTVIDTALEEARRLGHNYVGTEHLLLAMVQRRQLLPDGVAELLPDADAMRSALTVALGATPRRDAELLRTVGIDLDEIRSAVRQTFGDEVLDQLGRRRVHQPWQPWRRPFRRCTSILAGTMSVAPRVKQSLERARRDADRRGLPAIDPTALLLGMVEIEDAMANQLLRTVGLDPSGIRRALTSFDH